MTHDTQPKRELVGAHRWQGNGTRLIWWKVPLEPGWWQLCADAVAINHTPQTCTGRLTRLLMQSVAGLQVFEQVLIVSGCVYVRWTVGPNCNTHTHTFTWLKQNFIVRTGRVNIQIGCLQGRRWGNKEGLGGSATGSLVQKKTGWCFIQGKQTMGKMGGGGFIHFELSTGVSYWLWLWWGSAYWLGSGSGVMVALWENGKSNGWE